MTPKKSPEPPFAQAIPLSRFWSRIGGGMLFVLFVACSLGGAVLSAIITVGAWQVQIDPRAFQCWDDVGIFDTYWEAIDEHRDAGDKISPGWTWDEIKTAREIYIVAFYLIWAAGSLFPFRFISRRINPTSKSPEQMQTAP